MRTGILRLMPMFALVLSGCISQENAGEGPAGPAYGSDFRNASYRASERAALRVRRDEALNRVWMLNAEGVRVYDAATKQLIRAIELSGWSIAGVACRPDLALDSRGSAVVSSNVQPMLWLIDPVTFAVTVREVRLLEREQWDVGFGALAYSADGILLASTYQGGTLWRVDVEKGAAQVVLASAARSCSLAQEPGSRLERGR